MWLVLNFDQFDGIIESIVDKVPISKLLPFRIDTFDCGNSFIFFKLLKLDFYLFEALFEIVPVCDELAEPVVVVVNLLDAFEVIDYLTDFGE